MTRRFPGYPAGPGEWEPALVTVTPARGAWPARVVIAGCGWPEGSYTTEAYELGPRLEAPGEPIRCYTCRVQLF